MTTAPTPRLRVLVIDEDLLFSTRVESTLLKLGYDVDVVSDPDQAVEMAADYRPALTILNFGREGLRPLETVSKLKEQDQPGPVLGFLSHKLIPDVREAAREAGCDLLVPNSALVMRLAPLVERLAPRDGSYAQIVEAEELAEAEP
ncbi:MAG TPA: response regulator [Chthonomonadaceae bacterium]|nr:response regulator [Chthonomonadaceae bacterium]